MDKKDFHLEDYKMKVDFFTKHFSRVWMRFNFFLAVQGASIGLGAKIILENKEVSLNEELILYYALNIFICVVWYIFGAQDRYLTILYRKQGHKSGRDCANAFGISDYEPVGSTENTSQEITPTFNIIQWRSNVFSMTRLPAVVPIIFTTGWLIILINGFC